MTEQLVLIPADHADPIDPRDQVRRVPGVDAPCPSDCGRTCRWPWCTCHQPLRITEAEWPEIVDAIETGRPHRRLRDGVPVQVCR